MGLVLLAQGLAQVLARGSLHSNQLPSYLMVVVVAVVVAAMMQDRARAVLAACGAAASIMLTVEEEVVAVVVVVVTAAQQLRLHQCQRWCHLLLLPLLSRLWLLLKPQRQSHLLLLRRAALPGPQQQIVA